jgi:DNA repair protein RecO (recombination protein O)
VSTEKADAIVIRQADFSESSRVITFFSREFGKFAVLAKGAKRLKGPFDAALDLLSTCRIVFIRKSSGTLSLLTQASLLTKFTPVPTSLNALYGGYYIADLLCGLTEDEDPDSILFQHARQALRDLGDSSKETLTTIVQFEVGLLQCSGLFPNLSECSVCSQTIETKGKYAHWVSQGGLLCSACRRDEYAGRSISAGAIALLSKLTAGESNLADRIRLTHDQALECHRLALSAIISALGKKPGTLRYLKF